MSEKILAVVVAFVIHVIGLGGYAVSYTHLDVYKRQHLLRVAAGSAILFGCLPACLSAGLSAGVASGSRPGLVRTRLPGATLRRFCALARCARSSRTGSGRGAGSSFQPRRQHLRHAVRQPPHLGVRRDADRNLLFGGQILHHQLSLIHI